MYSPALLNRMNGLPPPPVERVERVCSMPFMRLAPKSAGNCSVFLTISDMVFSLLHDAAEAAGYPFWGLRWARAALNCSTASWRLTGGAGSSERVTVVSLE